MSEKSIEDLKNELEILVRDYCNQCSEFGYNPTAFKQMINKEGGAFEAIRRLIYKPDVSKGFITLWDNGKLKLSMEALILENPQFQCLFTPDEREIARKRLKEYSYTPKEKN